MATTIANRETPNAAAACRKKALVFFWVLSAVVMRRSSPPRTHRGIRRGTQVRLSTDTRPATPVLDGWRHEALRRRTHPSFPPAPRRRAVRAVDRGRGLARPRRPARDDGAGRRRSADGRLCDLTGRRTEQCR